MNPQSTRRNLLSSVALLSACTRRFAATGCEALKNQKIRWLVPYPPGGSYDVFSRLLELPLEKALGAEILIANEAGGGGLIGASKLRDAVPDGRTLGVVNAPGLMSGSLAGEAATPNPARDFTVIGRLSRVRSAIVTSASSPLKTVDDLILRQSTKPLLFGVTGASSNNLLCIAATTSLLGLNMEYVAGYAGSREELLAVMRGEVDLISANYETLQDGVESGELRVLLQLTDTPVSSHPALATSGVLGGSEGWAARRSQQTGRSVAQAVDEAHALAEAIGAGIIVVAPKQLSAELTSCLRSNFDIAVKDQRFLDGVRAARRSLDLTNGATTQAELKVAETQFSRFAPLVRAAIARIRK